MNTLVNANGEIQVRGIMNDVVPVTDEELETYANIDFDLEGYKKDIGCKHLIHKDDKVTKKKPSDKQNNQLRIKNKSYQTIDQIKRFNQ